MMTTIQSIEKKLLHLSMDKWEEVENFVEFLISKEDKRAEKTEAKKPTFSWAGGLADMKEQYTSVQLQKAINDMRIDGLST